MGQSMRILTINTGSSSLKAAVYMIDHVETLAADVRIERIGQQRSSMRVVDAIGRPMLDEHRELATHAAAFQALLAWLEQQGWAEQLQAVGHRVVHGGPRYREPRLLTPEILAALEQLVALAPRHLPQALHALQAMLTAYPTLPQVVCFDTAFHRHLSRVAQLYALPRRYVEAGVLRYGFHGLSYEFIMRELQALDSDAAQGRIIIAHLGNGSSMAAVRAGVGIDTTMGFTPAGGLVMGTRAGDLDPGVVLYLLQAERLTPADLNTLLNQQAGLLGLSGLSSDMQELLSNEATDPHAAEAIALFCYQAKKFLGALVAALGGLDTLVFTGGIGEHAAPVRAQICAGLEVFGIQLDLQRNATNQPIISPANSPVVVRVVPTDEDRMIARHTHRLVTPEGGSHV